MIITMRKQLTGFFKIGVAGKVVILSFSPDQYFPSFPFAPPKLPTKKFS
jgi:hypothetical protein